MACTPVTRGYGKQLSESEVTPGCCFVPEPLHHRQSARVWQRSTRGSCFLSSRGLNHFRFGPDKLPPGRTTPRPPLSCVLTINLTPRVVTLLGENISPPITA
ncbi:hypothetical protein J6590_023832 [Homalodisca vitripennis]|nr:hypothetical protein J6590_023832 [Homalodisca vitripennis]